MKKRIALFLVSCMALGTMAGCTPEQKSYMEEAKKVSNWESFETTGKLSLDITAPGMIPLIEGATATPPAQEKTHMDFDIKGYTLNEKGKKQKGYALLSGKDDKGKFQLKDVKVFIDGKDVYISKNYMEDIMKYSTNGELPKRVTDVKQEYILIANGMGELFTGEAMTPENTVFMQNYMDTMTNPEKRDELFTKFEKVFELIEFNLPLKKEGQATYTMKVNSDEFIDRAVHSLDKTVMNLDQILKSMEWKEIIPEGDSVAEIQKEYANGKKEEIMKSVPDAKKLLKGSYLNTKETFSEDNYKGEMEANICVNEPLYLKVNMKIDTESKKVAKKEVKVPTRAEAITLQEYMDLYMPAVKDTIVLDTKTNVLKSEKNGTQVKLKTTKNAEGEVMYEFAPIMRSFGVEFGYDQKVHQVYYIDNGVKEYVDDVVEKNGISYISIENIDYRWVSDAMSEDDGNTYRYVIREAE